MSVRQPWRWWGSWFCLQTVTWTSADHPAFHDPRPTPPGLKTDKQTSKQLNQQVNKEANRRTPQFSCIFFAIWWEAIFDLLLYFQNAKSLRLLTCEKRSFLPACLPTNGSRRHESYSTVNPKRSGSFSQYYKKAQLKVTDLVFELDVSITFWMTHLVLHQTNLLYRTKLCRVNKQQTNK